MSDLNDLEAMMVILQDESSGSDFFGSSSSDLEDCSVPVCPLISSSSSDSSDTTYEPPSKKHNVGNYMKVIEKYNDHEFSENFRLKRSTCEIIINKIECNKVLPTHKFGRKKVSAKQALYMTLHYLVNTITFRQIGNLYCTSRSSAHRIITKIINYLVKESPQYIVWPDQQQKTIIKNKFYKKQEIYGVIGIIDVSHIPIKRSNSKHTHAYCSSNNDCSILIQGVCDHTKKFIDAYVGEPGSIHDARLLKMSSLYEKGWSGEFVDEFLLGDSAYPSLSWLVPPFKDNGALTQQQKIFNRKHSLTRITIANSFGLLKCRFRRLKWFENDNIEFITKCVVAAMVLHNICIDCNDMIDYENEDGEADLEDDAYIVRGSDREQNFNTRDKIFNIMFNN